MAGILEMKFEVDGEDYGHAGEASSKVKATLKEIGMPSTFTKRVAIAMYEGEINMVIHGNGGVANVEIDEDMVKVTLTDKGKGIPDVDKAMQEGYSAASDGAKQMGFGAGMGLPNMKKHSDEMIIDSKVGEGTTVVLTFYVNQR